MSRWHSMQADQVLKELNVNPHQGLSAAEVRSRLEKYGYNELKRERPIALASIRFIRQLKNILVMILFIAAVLLALGPPIVGISIPGFLTDWSRIIARAM
jgi:magnesium-transporting ATPase (P-type)